MNKNDYKNIFVFAEQRGGKIQPVALELIGKASDLAAELGEKVVAMLLGYNVSFALHQYSLVTPTSTPTCLLSYIVNFDLHSSRK